MNVIVIVIDSFRRDHTGVYGHGDRVFEGVPACKTPNIDRFAEQCIVFDHAYPEALPTIPIRRQMMTGQRTLPFHPWQPLSIHDRTMAEILKRDGYVSALIADTYHYRAPGMNYHRGFDVFRWIRGQEWDAWVSSPPKRDVAGFVKPEWPAHWKNRIGQFIANTDDIQEERDRFPAQVVDQAVEWLKLNRGHDKKFLWVDSFDPHEPWDPPPRFDVYTDPTYTGPRLIMPLGGDVAEWATPEEVDYIRGLYAGETAFVDDCLGRLFAALEELGYFEDSVIVLTADHGHPLADHGKFLKGPDRLYSELLDLMFMVRLPNGTDPRRTGAIVQFHDVLPTLLDLLGLSNNTEAMHGRTFAPVLRGETDEHRKSMIVGFHEGVDRCIRDGEWSYIIRPPEEPDELYFLPDDPHERTNLIDEHHNEAARLRASFGNYYFKVDQRVIKGVQGKYEMSSGTVE